jgi:hypothetical protein
MKRQGWQLPGYLLELQRSPRVFKEQEEAQRHHALETYWERWYALESSKRKTQRNFARWSGDCQKR